jgi:sigma-B regulation protein RsbU (phosphoserine phosphatase)
MGCFLDFVYKPQEINLAPDTTIFLYTDGLDEAENAGGKFFGKSRLKEVLKGTPPYPRTIIEQMTQAVNDFVGETEQSDDLTMLALKWKK